MKNNVYTYNPELGDAFMNLYKKIRKIEKKTTDVEKTRIYTCISAVMPDELSEIKRVIDRVQNPYGMINPAVNDTIQASSNYMMNVNAAEKAIDEMNTIAELFNYVRKKNGLQDNADVPMYLIGELKSAFESHDFELFEKLVMASNDDPYGFNHINNLVLSKMNESNDNTNGYDYTSWYPSESQSSEVCDQKDNVSIIEQLDEVFNDVSNDEESKTSSDDSATEPEKVDESQSDNLIQLLTIISSNDKVDESKIKEIDGDFLRELEPEAREHWLEYRESHITEAVDILKVKLDKHTAIALWKDIVELSNYNSPMNAACELSTKYKLNISPAVVYNIKLFINDKTRTGRKAVPWEIGLQVLDIILGKDGYNQFENDSDIMIEPKIIPIIILKYICKMIYACKFKSEIITSVKNKFDYDVNLWDIGAISYQLAINNGAFINDEGLIKYYIKKPWVLLRMTDKDGKRIPVSHLVVESVENEQETVTSSKKETEEETKELLDPSIVTKLPDNDDLNDFISEVFQALNTASSSPVQILSKLNNKYKCNVSIASLNHAYSRIRTNTLSTIPSDTDMVKTILSMDMRNKEGNIDTPDPSASLSIDELRFICDELSYKRRSEIVEDVLNKFGTHINTWEIGAISYVLINKLNGKYMGNFNSLQTELLNYRSFFNIPMDEPTTPRVKRKRRKKVEE